MLRRLLAIVLALSSPAAFADVVTITASGAVDSVSQTPELTPLLGLPFSVTLVYETPGVGVPTTTFNVVDYSASLMSFTATLGGQSLTGGTETVKELDVANDASLGSDIVDDFGALALHTGLALNFAGVGSFTSAETTLTLRDLDHTVFGDFSLPGSFDRSQYELQFLSAILLPPLGGFNTRVDAAISSFEISAVPSVPEPETYAMMLAGLALLGFLARGRSPSRASSIA